jgi:4-hydroxy-2-oxoheptanedioate aldolase
MPNENKLKRKLLAGQPCLGAWLLTTSPDVAEVLAFGGLDFVVMDHEHGQGGITDAIDQLRALKGSDCTGIVRVPTNDHIYIRRILDTGAGGIMVPNISNREQAKRVVDACRYPPVGIRGAAGGIRAMAYGFNPDYYDTAFEQLLIAVQVESSDAIDHIEEIAAVDGIDVIFIGPRDLSATLGKLNQFDDPGVKGEIARAEQAILRSGKILGSTAASGKIAKAMAQRGYKMIVPGSDATLLGLGIRTVLADAR